MLAQMAESAISKDDTLYAIEKTIAEEVFASTMLQSNVLLKTYVSPISSQIIVATTGSYQTFKFNLKPNQKYLIRTKNNVRFRAALVNSANNSSTTITYDQLLVDMDNTREFEFFNTNALELYVYTGVEDSNVSCSVSEYPYKFKYKIEQQLTSEDIKDQAVTIEKTDFVSKETINKEAVRKTNVAIQHSFSTDKTSLVSSTAAWSYVVDLEPNDFVEVSLTAGTNIRFRLAVMNRVVDSVASAIAVDRVVTLDDNLKSIKFENTNAGKQLFISLAASSATPAEVTAVPVVKVVKTHIAGLHVSVPEFEYKPTFKLDIGKIEDPTICTISNRAEYPRLGHVKYEYKPNTHPIPVGYLYTSLKTPYKFLYSSGIPDNAKELCDWNATITQNGARPPSDYSQFITDDGDIICVFRGDLLGSSSINPAARQNPIIYPAGDYNNPVAVQFGERIKPTAWARCNGITSIIDEDFFVFSEYTRPAHEKAYIWKVTKPYTDPDNWQRVFELTIDRPGSDPNHSAGQLKHFHATQYDPFSGAIIATTGDFEPNGPRVYMSKDLGDTWTLEGSESEKHYRLSQFIFDKDYVYWGSDAGSTNKHLFIRVPRDENGYPMLHMDNHTIVHQFPNVAGSVATYNTVYLRNPHGLLFLDFQDAVATTNPIVIKFYSFDTNTMHDIASIEMLEEYKGVERNGFRVDCVTQYQPLNDDRIVCGFNPRSAVNAMNVAGNSQDHQVNNLTLRVIKTV